MSYIKATMGCRKCELSWNVIFGSNAPGTPLTVCPVCKVDAIELHLGWEPTIYALGGTLNWD